MAQQSGSHLNKLWNVGAAHALYLQEGHWYHHLKRFPGALFDHNGFVVFETAAEYFNSPYLKIGKHVHVRKPGISAIPGYTRVRTKTRDFKKIVLRLTNAINSKSQFYRIGNLQELRKTLHNLKRIPSKDIFNPRTIKANYAFHQGGRKELQFNIGVELINRTPYIRHGIAFSLEPSRSLPSVDALIPKVGRLNEFIRIHPDFFEKFRMWHYERDNIRSTDYMVAPIAPELVKPGVFIFIGENRPINETHAGLILSDFDLLLPVYEFVESQEPFPFVEKPPNTFNFRPGCVTKKNSVIINLPMRQIDVQLRHNELQKSLYFLLTQTYGSENVRGEQLTKDGMRIDVVLKCNEEYWFFEIKTSLSARACIREALPQLLEYSYWPGSQEASRLIVIGEPPLDREAGAYLKQLKDRFGLPIDYQQLDISQGILIGTT